MKTFTQTFLALVVMPTLAVAARADEKAARHALADFEAAGPRSIGFGDPVWKANMSALVRLARAGPPAVPVLEEAQKTGTPFVRAFAAEALAHLRGPEGVRSALAGYDLATLDTARLGRVAPDFSLDDASDKSWTLGQFRGKKSVVLVFIAEWEG